MKYYLILIVILLLALFLLFQEKTLPDNWKSYIENVNSNAKGYKILESLCFDIGGRVSGTEKGRKAENFVIEQLKSFGYQDIEEDTFSHQGWERISCSLQLDSEPGKEIKVLSLGLTPDTSNIKTEIVDVNGGIPEDYMAIQQDSVKGKLVLVDMKTISGKKRYHRVDKVQIAADNGAAGIIFYNSMFGDVISIGTAAYGKISAIPAVSISREDGMKIRNQLYENKKIIGILNVKNKVQETESANISTELPGSELDDEVVLISAHLDAWDVGQGAIDNGSSVAVVLEIARQFKLQNIHPKRRIRFTFFMAEEFGLVGSTKFVDSHEVLMKKLFYVINLEMNLAPNGINLLLDDRDREWFETLCSNLEGLGMEHRVIADPWLESDHTAFMLKGIPTLTFEENSNIFSRRTYHSNQDNIRYVSEKDMLNCSKVVGIVLLEIANSTKLKKWNLTQEQVQMKVTTFGIDDKLELRKISVIKN